MVAPVLLVTSDDPHLILRAMEDAVARVRDDVPDVDVTVHEASETPHLPDLRTGSLFGGRTCAVLRGMENPPGSLKDDVEAYLEAPDPDSVLVIVARGTAKIQKIAKQARQVGQEIVSKLPSPWRPEEWPDLVRGEVRRAGRRMDLAGIQEIIERSGHAPAVIASNVAQVCLAHPGVDTLTAEHVAQVVQGIGNQGAMAVADAVMDRDPARAVVALRGALEAGEAPLGILGMLAFRIRDVLTVRGGAGQDGQELLSHARWNPASPTSAGPKRVFPNQVGDAVSAGKRFGPGEVGWCHDRLARADLELKGDTDLPDELVMELLVIDLATPRTPGPPWVPQRA